MKAKGGLGESVKMLQHLQEQMDADMSRVDVKSVQEFRMAKDLLKRKQVQKLWEALTDDKSDRRLEHGWFCDNVLLLRIYSCPYTSGTE